MNITPPNAITLPPTSLVSFPQNSWIPHTRLARRNDTNVPHTRLSNGTNIFTNMQLGDDNADRFINSHHNSIQNNSRSTFKEELDDEKSNDMPLDIESVEN